MHERLRHYLLGRWARLVCDHPVAVLVVAGLLAAAGIAVTAVRLKFEPDRNALINPDLEWLGVALNIADMRTVHSREAYTQLKEHFSDKVFDTTIRSSIAYAESAERAISILDHRPDLGSDYLRLTEEILAQLDLPEARRRLKRMLTEAGVPA